MTVSQMRARITEVYAGKSWKQKVDNMSEGQVIAVYHSFLNSGKFNNKPQTKARVPNKRDDVEYKQMKINI